MWEQYKRERRLSQRWAEDHSPLTKAEHAKHVAFVRKMWMALIAFMVAFVVASASAVYVFTENADQIREENFRSLCETQKRLSDLNGRAAESNATVYLNVADAVDDPELASDLRIAARYFEALGNAKQAFANASCEQVPPPPPIPEDLQEMPELSG